MTEEEIKAALMSLSEAERKALIEEIESSPELHTSLLSKRKEMFDNKIGSCPHCNSKKYRKHGVDKGRVKNQ